MTEKQTDEFNGGVQSSADRIMGRPSSLGEAIKMDFNALLPQSEIARERRARVVEFGKNVLNVLKKIGIGVSIAVPVGVFATAAVDNFILPKVEVGSTVTDQGRGEGLSDPIIEGLQIISNETGNDVTGADYRDGTTDLSNEGVGDGYPGMPVEVTAYKSPIFGFPSVEATTKIETEQPVPTETFPPALPLEGAEDIKND